MVQPTFMEREQKSDEHHFVIATTDVRQGVTNHNVRYVLAASLMLAIFAFVILYVIYN